MVFHGGLVLTTTFSKYVYVCVCLSWREGRGVERRDRVKERGREKKAPIFRFSTVVTEPMTSI